MQNPKFNVGDKVVVLFHKQHGEVLEVFINNEWNIVRYKIKVATGTVTIDEKWVRSA